MWLISLCVINTQRNHRLDPEGVTCNIGRTSDSGGQRLLGRVVRTSSLGERRQARLVKCLEIYEQWLQGLVSDTLKSTSGEH